MSTKSSITIRQAIAADADIISRLNTTVQTLHAENKPDIFKPTDANSFPPEAARALISGENNFIFIALIDDDPVGYIYTEVRRKPETLFTHPIDALHIHHISVSSTIRGKGVGTHLMNAAFAKARELKVKHVTTEVWRFNQIARTFFSKFNLDCYVERLSCDL